MIKKGIVLIILIIFMFFAPSAALSVTVSPESLDYTICYVVPCNPDDESCVPEYHDWDSDYFFIINNGNTRIKYDLDIPDLARWDIFSQGEPNFWVEPQSLEMVTLDLSNMDEEGPILPIGEYWWIIKITAYDEDEETVIMLPGKVHIIDCGAPPNPVPEFPVMPGLSLPFVTIGLVGAMISMVLLVRMNTRK